MERSEWKVVIKSACEEAGTYRECFDSVIDTLSCILETRDTTQKEYDANKVATVEHTNNRGGGVNMVKNPALALLLELNSQALSYWRELGLTPSGLKKINDSALKGKKKSSLAETLASLK